MTTITKMPPQGPDKTEAMRKIEEHLRHAGEKYLGYNTSPWCKWKELAKATDLPKNSSVHVREAVSLLVRYHGARIVTHPKLGYCWAYNAGVVKKDIDRLQQRINIMTARLEALQKVHDEMEREQ